MVIMKIDMCAIGNIVKLGNGPKMVVLWTHNSKAQCEWFADGSFDEDSFSIEALTGCHELVNVPVPEVGKCVRHATLSGPRMTVEYLKASGTAGCAWFESRRLFRREFLFSSITVE